MYRLLGGCRRSLQRIAHCANERWEGDKAADAEDNAAPEPIITQTNSRTPKLPDRTNAANMTTMDARNTQAHMVMLSCCRALPGRISGEKRERRGYMLNSSCFQKIAGGRFGSRLTDGLNDPAARVEVNDKGCCLRSDNTQLVDGVIGAIFASKLP